VAVFWAIFSRLRRVDPPMEDPVADEDDALPDDTERIAD
jgi:hypothetical protein